MEDKQNTKSSLEVNNPLTALTEIFYKPKAVFDALAVKENWSWLPFILLAVVLFFPSYLYFSVVDFDWWRENLTQAMFGDLSPAEQDNYMGSMTLSVTQLSDAITNAIVYPIIGYAFIALYYNVVTRNDEKSVQGFSDWYGAMWWMAMPSLIAALISIVILTLQEPNSQLIDAIRYPLSLAYLFNSSVGSPHNGVLIMLRLDLLWSIYLGYVCLKSWTQFSTQKAAIVALTPFVVLTLFTFASGLVQS